jgi:hypothetical protein
MAFTAQQKQALATWLEANIHKAIHPRTHREGIKDEDGKAVYGTIFAGTEDEYYGRTFIERTLQVLDIREVVRRVRAKAIKHGFNPTEAAVRDLLREHRATIKTWLPADTLICAGHSTLTNAEIDAEDPDA